ncbi:MAG: aminotransferase class I/II-fold pyridoxal phosphate-dependent enzyme [Thaumarchaeota archaeon]|nr:aminotransferase class I/II-fold pyridoxal phosphate-dependent enzyme [Nitrososphaerota archaeon]MDG6907475.1 aminotransferase class I/II-fold pyridoxal phosphate-dependent enzyme [Nitrososphaerota archaeon]
MERTLVVNGLSKAYGMTGWRLGYLLARKDFGTI